MKRLTLLLLLAPACAGRDIPLVEAGIPDWVCQKSYRMGEDFFWINQVVDGAGAPKETSVRWRSTAVEMAWLVRDPGRWFEHPSEVKVQIPLRSAPREAVSTQVLADGRLIDEREQLSQREARRRPKGTAILLAAFFHAPEKVPQLYGVRDLRMKAVTRGGSVVVEARLPLPDWSVADKHVEEGRREVESMADDYVARCEQQTGGEI